MVVLPVPIADVSVIVSGPNDRQQRHVIPDRWPGAGHRFPRDSRRGRALPGHGPHKALTADAEGVVDGQCYSAHSVTGTDWRVVMATSKAALLAPVQATGRVAWQIFAAFAAAMIAILLIGLGALLSSAVSRAPGCMTH